MLMGVERTVVAALAVRIGAAEDTVLIIVEVFVPLVRTP